MSAGELDLSNPDSFAQGVPHAYFQRLRREAPIAWQAESDGPGFWVVTKYDDVRRISKDPAGFSSALGGIAMYDPPADTLPALRTQILYMDPPQHSQYRRLVNRGFTVRMIEKLEPEIRRLVTRIIDGIAHRGSCEFVSEVAAVLPAQVICTMMGVAPEDQGRVAELSDRIIGVADPEFQSTPEDDREARVEMFRIAGKVAARAMREPGDDLATVLVTADVEGARLTEAQFSGFFLLLMLAGTETTRTAAAHGMRLLSEYPEQRARLLREPSMIAGAVEEILRFNPPVMYFRRTATRDVEIRDVCIRAGDKVTLWYPSANRDEEVFEAPDRFDVARTPNEHLTFGIGEHFCLGANLARLELRVLFEGLLRRLPDITVAGPLRRLRSNMVDGIKEMPVRFTPAG